MDFDDAIPNESESNWADLGEKHMTHGVTWDWDTYYNAECIVDAGFLCHTVNRVEWRAARPCLIPVEASIPRGVAAGGRRPVRSAIQQYARTKISFAELKMR